MAGKKIAIRILLLSVSVALVACNQDQDVTPVKAQTQPAAQDAASPSAPKLSLPPDSGPPPTIDSARAMQYTREIVAFGPRPLGTANHNRVADFITSHLKGDAVEDDVFTADTPEGKFPVRNIIAKFPGARDGMVVIASHYDTNYTLRNTSFIGANDGAATSALLLEFANQLRGKKLDGYSVWLLWDDAEEAVKAWGSALQPARYGGWSGFDNL